MTIIWRSEHQFTVSLHYKARLFPPYEAWLRRGHEKARCRYYRDQLARASGAYTDQLPPLDDLMQELRENGVAQRHLSYFGIPYNTMVTAADRMCAELARKNVEGANSREVSDDERMLAEPEPFLYVLSEPLLDLAERYMGLPVRYFGVAVKREVANGVLEHVRRFHIDPEDESVLKIIVYLNDVDAGIGPFQCISASETVKIGRARDAALERIVPPSNWITCLGPRLTANICDTARCLHRASPPTVTDRYSITFSYLSERPYLAWAKDIVRQRRFRERWGSLLNARQLMAL